MSWLSVSLFELSRTRLFAVQSLEQRTAPWWTVAEGNLRWRSKQEPCESRSSTAGSYARHWIASIHATYLMFACSWQPKESPTTLGELSSFILPAMIDRYPN